MTTPPTPTDTVELAARVAVLEQQLELALATLEHQQTTIDALVAERDVNAHVPPR